MHKWFAWEVSRESAPIREQVNSGVILTLAPVYALEAGLGIVPEFAAGPFGLRSAHLVSPERRVELKLPASEDLATVLAHRMPDGILTGVEDQELEVSLIAFAKAHHYRRVKVGHKRTLWVNDKRVAAVGEE